MASTLNPKHKTSLGNTRPKPPPERQPEYDERKQREERILDAATVLLVRWGYRKTTIDDVAREAGVGKGTIYLHWKDKKELFRAVIWRVSEQASEDMMQRVAADPEGGLFHRVWAHGMLTLFSHPLLAALMTGKSDILQGMMDSLDPETLNKLAGNASDHVAQLQRAGLVRPDLPVSVITYLMGALKMGLMNMAEFGVQEDIPSREQLTEAISDLMRRWLEPEHLPSDSAVGKDIMAKWMKQATEIEKQ